MADYIIGDIQGCYEPLMRLIDLVNYNPDEDQLWCVGDLVNRGPQSLAVLRFFRDLDKPAIITLGNHDLYLLYRLFVNDDWENHDDTIEQILVAPDALELGHWFRRQRLAYANKHLGLIITHAGIPPLWSLTQTLNYAKEVEDQLSSDQYQVLLASLFGNHPTHWEESLTGMARLRCIINFLTRMRFCEKNGDLNLSYKGTLEAAPSHLIPWYAHPLRREIDLTIVFGHWAALGTLSPAKNVIALDTGCVWGNALTALRVQDKQFFSVRA